MKKIMISPNTLGLLISALLSATVITWVVACRVFRNRQPKPFCGYVRDIQVIRPTYTDPTRIGTRIDFLLRLWGNGGKRTKIKSISGVVSTSVATGMNILTRPLLKMNPLKYNYVFREGVDVPFDVCMYLDDIKPEDVDGDTLMVEVVDTDGVHHIFGKKPGTKRNGK